MKILIIMTHLFIDDGLLRQEIIDKGVKYHWKKRQSEKSTTDN